MEEKERSLIDILYSIDKLEKEVYDYIVNTDHWLLYWITNKEVQDFIKGNPDDFEDKVSLSISGIHGSSIYCKIMFEDHPKDVEYIQRYCVLSGFRDSVEKNWSQYSNNIKEYQTKELKKNLEYYKRKLKETEESLRELEE